MPDKDDPPQIIEVVPIWALHLSERLTRLEVKMNLIQALAGASFISVLSLAIILLTGAKIA